MTENYSPASMPPLRGAALPPEQDTAALPPLPPEQDTAALPPLPPEQGTADVVKDQAADLGHSGVQAGKHTAGVAREQAAGVAAEAGRPAALTQRPAQLLG